MTGNEDILYLGDDPVILEEQRKKFSKLAIKERVRKETDAESNQGIEEGRERCY